MGPGTPLPAPRRQRSGRRQHRERSCVYHPVSCDTFRSASRSIQGGGTMTLRRRRNGVKGSDETRRPRLVAYCRVSTEEQRDEGVSLAAQRERVAAFAVAHGFDLAAVEEDAG